MTVSGLIALLMDCLSAIVVNYCILYAYAVYFHSPHLPDVRSCSASVEYDFSQYSCFSVSSFT